MNDNDDSNNSNINNNRNLPVARAVMMEDEIHDPFEDLGDSQNDNRMHPRDDLERQAQQQQHIIQARAPVRRHPPQRQHQQLENAPNPPVEPRQEDRVRRPQRRWWGRLRMMNNNAEDEDEDGGNNNDDDEPVAMMIPRPRSRVQQHDNNVIDLVEDENVEEGAGEAQPQPPPLLGEARRIRNPEVRRVEAVAAAPPRRQLLPPRRQLLDMMMIDDDNDIDNNNNNDAAVNDFVNRRAERDIRRADRHAFMHERLRQRRQQRQEPPRRVRIRGGERLENIAAVAVPEVGAAVRRQPQRAARAPPPQAAEAGPIVVNLADDNDDDDDDLMMMDILGDEVAADGAAANVRRHIWGRRLATRRGRETTSSYLFHMVKEGRMCTSVLSGWGRSEQGCNSIVEHCEANPDEANYLSEQGRTPIHEACLRGACRHVIKALIAANNNGAMDRDHHGNSPLHLLFIDYSSSTSSSSSPSAFANTNSNIVWSPKDLDEVVGDLLEVNPTGMGAIVNAYGDTPLHSACMASETMVDPNSIVKLLAANSASASRMNRKNQTPLRVHCQRRNASPEVARLLLDANPDALTVLDNESGWAPIHYAASNANFDLLQVLVEFRPEAVQVRTSQRQTALHLLCRQHTHLSSSNNNRRTIVNNMSSSGGFSEVAAAVGLLLKADPEAIMHQDANNSYTPLHLVCKTEGARQVPVQVVQLLLRCNPKAAAVPDSEQYLPLHHACEMGSSLEVIQALIEAYPDATKVMTRKQDSALSLASTCNKGVDTVKLLIELNPAALTKKNNYGFAPLHCICRAHQPRMGIVQALVDACPSSVHLQNNAGETPIHLASSNSGAFVGVLQLLTTTQNRNQKPPPAASSSLPVTASTNSKVATLPTSNGILSSETNSRNHPTRNATFTSRLFDQSGKKKKKVTNNKMGNTPLHDACFKSTPFEKLEVIAKANPEYILVSNNAGYTPLQILCKNGRIDERIISTFAQMGGPEIFSVKDSNGNTPLHSAMRPDINVSSLKCLIRASPDAIRFKTTNGDSPLHLACLRKCSEEVIREVAMAASNGDTSPALESNLAAQTPIGIAMAEFRGICQDGGSVCCISSSKLNQTRIFQVLATLVKIVFHGPVRCQHQGLDGLSLLRACVVLHRQNIRLDPAFIRQVIHLYPEEVKIMDEDGNFPLHIEASIPVEKMSLLDGSCYGPSHKRMEILRILLDAYPHACAARNKENQFPLGLMIQNGRLWGHSLSVALRAFPPALHWYSGLDDRFSAILLEKASKECGADTLFQLLQSRPGLFEDTSHHS